MRLLADMHISPRTAEYLVELGHNVIRVPQVLPASSSDQEILEFAGVNDRVILTQDLDFSALVAISGAAKPSLITLRLSSSMIEHVNEVLRVALPRIESHVALGVIAVITDHRIRMRTLPMK